MARCCIKECKHEEEAMWAWQPFGPGEDYNCFTFEGEHYRGFAALHVCDACKKRIQAGGAATWRYKRHFYWLQNGKILNDTMLVFR
jgi:hypothetical protein